MKYELQQQKKEAEHQVYLDIKKELDNALDTSQIENISEKDRKKLDESIEKESSVIFNTSLEAIQQNPTKSDKELLPIVLENLSKNSKIRLIRKLSKNALKYLEKGEYK